MSVRVLMVVASEDDGGMGRVVHLLARHLGALDVSMDVAVHREAPLTEWLRQCGVPVTVVPDLIETPTRPRTGGATGVKALVANLAGLLRACEDLRALAERSAVDVIYSHGTWANYVAAIAAARSRRRSVAAPAVVWHIHNEHSARGTRALDGLFARVGRVSEIAAVSRSMAAPFLARGTAATVVTNGIDLPSFERSRQHGALRSALALDQADFVVAYVGRLVPHKGIDVLLDAARIAAASVPRLHVAILGGSPRHDPGALARLTARVAGWGLADRIHLPGHVPDVARYLVDADVATVPSTCADGFPLAAIEALCLGVPVVASNHGGLPELVRDGIDGVLVPPGDAARLAEALVALARDPERRRRMSDAAEEGRVRFDASAMARQVADLLHRAAARSAAGSRLEARG